MRRGGASWQDGWSALDSVWISRAGSDAKHDSAFTHSAELTSCLTSELADGSLSRFSTASVQRPPRSFAEPCNSCSSFARRRTSAYSQCWSPRGAPSSQPSLCGSVDRHASLQIAPSPDLAGLDWRPCFRGTQHGQLSSHVAGCRDAVWHCSQPEPQLHTQDGSAWPCCLPPQRRTEGCARRGSQEPNPRDPAFAPELEPEPHTASDRVDAASSQHVSLCSDQRSHHAAWFATGPYRFGRAATRADAGAPLGSGSSVADARRALRKHRVQSHFGARAHPRSDVRP